MEKIPVTDLTNSKHQDEEEIEIIEEDAVPLKIPKNSDYNTDKLVQIMEKGEGIRVNLKNNFF